MNEKLCLYCDIEMLPVITSFADEYEPAAIHDDPRAAIRYWTGEYYCPKCHRTSPIPETDDQLKKYAEWFKLHPKELEEVVPRVREKLRKLITVKEN